MGQGQPPVNWWEGCEKEESFSIKQKIKGMIDTDSSDSDDDDELACEIWDKSEEDWI